MLLTATNKGFISALISGKKPAQFVSFFLKKRPFHNLPANSTPVFYQNHVGFSPKEAKMDIDSAHVLRFTRPSAVKRDFAIPG